MGRRDPELAVKELFSWVWHQVQSQLAGEKVDVPPFCATVEKCCFCERYCDRTRCVIGYGGKPSHRRRIDCVAVGILDQKTGKLEPWDSRQDPEWS